MSSVLTWRTTVAGATQQCCKVQQRREVGPIVIRRQQHGKTADPSHKRQQVLISGKNIWNKKADVVRVKTNPCNFVRKKLQRMSAARAICSGLWRLLTRNFTRGKHTVIGYVFSASLNRILNPVNHQSTTSTHDLRFVSSLCFSMRFCVAFFPR